MALHLIAVHHAEHGLGAVEALASGVPDLVEELRGRPDLGGVLVLATCNRVEVYLDAEVPPSRAAAHVRDALGMGADDPLTVVSDAAAIRHLFRVTAGLDSMVVGDREVAAQVRAAVQRARRSGTASGLVLTVAEQALRTARAVARRTGLSRRGRSVVSVALDLVDRSWDTSRVLLLGTGAYAGAVVADLRSRGCADIAVQSDSGRAEAFAARHAGVRPLTGEVAAALADADVVLTCRGAGRPTVTADAARAAVAARSARAAADLVLVDLAVGRDVEPACGDLDGILLLDLPTVSRHVPDASRRDVARAEELVRAGVEETLARLQGRAMDPAVVALRDTVLAMVCDEVERLPVGRPLTHEETAHALRRLAARLVHVPSVRARQAAVEGRSDAYLAALNELWGLEPGTRPLLGPADAWDPDDEAVEPDTLEDDTCPVTGLTLGDLGEPPRQEAM